MPNMKLEIDESIIKKQLVLNEGANEELESLFPKEAQHSAIIKPTPGFCVKTKDNSNQQKAFVNVCTSDAVPAPEDISNDELLAILESEDPTDFRGKNICCAYDVIINPGFLNKLKDNPLFENFFMIVTIESLEEKYNVSLDKNSWVTLKNKKYHGNMTEQRVRTTYPLIQELSGIKSWSSKDFGPPDSEKGFKKTKIEELPPSEPPLMKEVKTTKLSTEERIKKRPKFEIIGKCQVNDRECLKAEVAMPSLVGDATFELSIGEDRIVLETEEYFLDEFIPYTLDAKNSRAFFVENIRVVVLILALMKKIHKNEVE
ncbi:PIH1 domain-containing protein 1 [Armadillidium vulgare]|nr:PIH1 domain-containing protein 1 [Armadillidium vulgare]